MLRDRGNRQPGMGPVDHAGLPGPAGGPRRSSRRGEPTADPGSAHRAPAEVRQARTPDGDLAEARGGHMSTTLLRSAEACTTVRSEPIYAERPGKSLAHEHRSQDQIRGCDATGAPG